MDLIKLLDVSSPKNIKNVINTLIREYENVAENFPTKLSDLTDDETHRLVTDNEKASWNAKLSSIPNDYKTKTENDNLYQPKGDYLTSFTETDPTVPAWAKQSNKPEYEYSEIKNTPVIPINNNQLTNGAGYITATRPAGQGVGFISKDNAGFTIYGDSVSENLYTYIINSEGKSGWYKLLDTNGKLYSGHKEVAVKEEVPSVNNPTITIKQGEETKGTFTLNQTEDKTIELDVGGGGGSNVTLYEELGQNTDGAMTQKAVTDELANCVTLEDLKDYATKDDVSFNLPMGAIFKSATPQTSKAFHLLDGSVLDATVDASYQTFINYINSVAAEYNIAVTDEEYETILATYGQCGKFVVTSTSVRLPTVTRHTEGLIDLTNIGEAVAAGLPNITGTFRFAVPGKSYLIAEETGGAFIGYNQQSCTVPGGSGSVTGNAYVNFDANNGASTKGIYGNSDTVQTDSIKYPYYIVVSTKEEVLNLETLTSEWEISSTSTEMYFKHNGTSIMTITSTGTILVPDVEV